MVDIAAAHLRQSYTPPSTATSEVSEPSTPKSHNFSKPVLQPPKPQLFTQQIPSKTVFSVERLLWASTENAMCEEANGAEVHQKDLEHHQKESDRLYKERVEKIHEAAKKEKQVGNWSLANQVFSWMTSFTAVVAGIALIATGVGAVAGSLMLIGGLVQLTSQILQVTGVWEKIATKLLPGEGSDDQKRAVMTWIQLAVAFFSIVMAGAGGVIAGWGAASAAMGAGNSALGSVIACAFGISSIGLGIKDAEFKKWIAWIKKIEIEKEKIRHLEESATERFHDKIEASTKDYGILTWILDIISQVNAAYQKSWR